MTAQNNTPYEFSVSCPFGLERVVASELNELGIKNTRPLSGSVAFFGSLDEAYRACLWLRAASRVLLVLGRFSAPDADALYEGIRAIPWQEHLTPQHTFAVHARGVNDALRNTQFTALKAKDAVCDSLVAISGKRPSVSSQQPDIRLELSLRAHKATIYLDLSGEPLHRRGYRTAGVQGEAPMKENLAAGMLLLSGWGLRQRPPALFDPLCGSGTLVLEAACIALDRAPGLSRDYWGFKGWLGYDSALWERLVTKAEHRFASGLSDAAVGNSPLLIGSDSDRRAIELARTSAEKLGVADAVHFCVAPVTETHSTLKAQLPEDVALPPEGMVVSNPPYAHRIGHTEDLSTLYREINAALTNVPPDWTLHLITPDDMLDTQLLRTPYQTETLFNGKIEAKLHHYRLGDSKTHSLRIPSPLNGSDVELRVLESGTEQFAARLKKVARERRKWAKREGVSCYRLYDSDLPDYAVAIDRYEGIQDGVEQVYYCVAEYKAPREIDPAKAARRYSDVLTVLPTVLGTDSRHIIPKLREQARGGEQYGTSGEVSTPLVVREHGHTFLADLSSYLDTGLFLDHRQTRALVESLAADKRFLNLFAYTGTATVYAAAGGAAATTTVDLSNTYIGWTQKNMRLNGFLSKGDTYKQGMRKGSTDNQDAHGQNSHRFIRADVLDWLKTERTSGSRYDLIFVDPPTFSNSKKMSRQSWSVQRDHVELLSDVAALLSKDGCAIFSCNLRFFKLDYENLEKAGIVAEDITQDTIPHDFSRNPKIHSCFLLRASATTPYLSQQEFQSFS